MNIGDFAAGEATDEHGIRRMNMLYQSEDFPTPGMAPPTSMYWPACNASCKRGLKTFRRLQYHAMVSNEVHNLARRHYEIGTNVKDGDCTIC